MTDEEINASIFRERLKTDDFIEAGKSAINQFSAKIAAKLYEYQLKEKPFCGKCCMNELTNKKWDYMRDHNLTDKTLDVVMEEKLIKSLIPKINLDDIGTKNLQLISEMPIKTKVTGMSVDGLPIVRMSATEKYQDFICNGCKRKLSMQVEMTEDEIKKFNTGGKK